MKYQQHITFASLGRWLGPLAFVALVATGCGGGSNTGDEAVTTPPPTAGTGDVSTPTTPTPPPTPPVAGISLLAGSIGGPGKSDGVGAAARFDRPSDVVVDAAGNVYVADTDNNAIRKITPQGAVTTLATRLDYPGRLAADANGNLYVTTTWSVRKITPTGEVTTLAGQEGVGGSADGVGAAACFDGTNGVALDGAGNVYVADTGNHTIRKISPSGVVTTLAGTAGAEGSADGTGPAARFSRPQSLTVDASGNVYVIDGNGIGRKITPEGVVTTTTIRAAAVAVDGIGNVYLADYNNHTIRKITPTGSPTTLAGTDGVEGSTDGVGAAASFFHPGGIAADSAGNVYVADTGNHTIRKIAPGGVVSTFAGSAIVQGFTDGTGAQASFNRPSGVAVDSTGSVYVADSGNSAFRKITPTGAVSTLARVPGAPFGLYPDFQQRFGGVAVDEAGNIYVADISNHAILKVTPSGIVTTLEGQAWSVWGTFGSREADWVSGTFGSDDTAGFYTPRSVAAAGIGSVYVTNLAGHYVHRGGCNLMGLCARYLSANAILKVSSRGEPPNQNCCSITTFAGAVGVNGSADGVGTSASFNEPNGIAVDAAGNVYVSDKGNYTIRKVTAAGVVTTLAGTAGVLGSSDGVGPAASFESPGSIAVDGAGNVYVSETNLERDGRYSGVIRKITSAGVVTTVAGARGSTDVKLGSLPGSLPEIKGIAVDAKGVLYVVTDAAVLKIQLPQ